MRRTTIRRYAQNTLLYLGSMHWWPMLRQTAGSRQVLVFIGEIYNYRELRKDLERDGGSFRSTSDTEILLQAYWWDLHLAGRDSRPVARAGRGVPARKGCIRSESWPRWARSPSCRSATP